MEDRYLVERRAFIHNRRLELGKTLEEIGAAVGVSKGTVQRWESGNISNMRRDKIAKLAAALEVTPAQLMGWEENSTPKQTSLALTGERIRFIRKARGFSAEYVANNIGVSPATVYRWENGDIEKVPGDSIEPLSRILGVTPAYLMGWEDEIDIPSPALTPAESILLSDFRRLNSNGQNEALFLIRHLAEKDEYKKSADPGSLPAAQ